ncbi:hypothetical protein CEB3_c10260 [Peptococcaceae bacterium CEB3]|nr:hypothetical protein CEB3_c10260 [Peptococcaceae bacterium CEB3]
MPITILTRPLTAVGMNIIIFTLQTETMGAFPVLWELVQMNTIYAVHSIQTYLI